VQPKLSFPVWDAGVDLPATDLPVPWIAKGDAVLATAVELRRGKKLSDSGDPCVTVWTWHPSEIGRWPVQHALNDMIGDLPPEDGGHKGALRRLSALSETLGTPLKITVRGVQVDALRWVPAPNCWVVRVMLSDGTNVAIAGQNIDVPELRHADLAEWGLASDC